MTERGAEETIINLLGVACPACNSGVGQRCTAPTIEGRRQVGWVHNARKDLAEGWT